MKGDEGKVGVAGRDAADCRQIAPESGGERRRAGLRRFRPPARRLSIVLPPAVGAPRQSERYKGEERGQREQKEARPVAPLLGQNQSDRQGT